MSSPNILLVFADQLRHRALGSSGNGIVRTPNLDRLAEEGAVFGRAFSSCPICSPFRGQLLTGRFAHANGVVDNEYELRRDEVTLAQALAGAGYRTGFIGKWHLGYGPYPEEKRYGFGYLAAYNCQHAYYDVACYENEDGPTKLKCWAPEGETSLAIRFMEEHQRRGGGSPFALVMGWGPPHWPYDQYPSEFDVYDPAEVDIPPNVPVQMEAFARKEIADYYGNVSALDAQMGRLMAALERLGIADNTIVCFTSDHGDHLSSHGYGKPFDRWMHHSMRASKATPYEESIHIPFLLRYPTRVRGGQRTETLLSSVDMMPTLLGLCGVEMPKGVQGHDLSHAVTGQDGTQPDSVYLQILGEGWPHRGKWVGFWRGVRTDRWLYARWHDNEYGPLLFDIENDAYEMTNLAGKPECRDVETKLEARLKEWMEATDDPFDTGARDPETGMLLLGQRFIHEKWERAV